MNALVIAVIALCVAVVVVAGLVLHHAEEERWHREHASKLEALDRKLEKARSGDHRVVSITPPRGTP